MTWPNPPEYVWNRLARIEEFPATANQDFKGCWLIDTDLSGGDLSGCDLRMADFRGTNLSGCDLVEARVDHLGLTGFPFSSK